MQYSDTEVYTVWYGPGTCGSFISTIIYDFIHGSSNIEFGDRGDSHERKIKCEYNWDRRGVENQPGLTDDYDICPVDPTKPLIITGHHTPNFEKLFHRFPKCKLIHISSGVRDLPRIQKNLVAKLGFDSTPHYLKFLEASPPAEYPHFILPMNDIIYNKKRTLKILSSITRRPVTEEIEQTYDDYLRKQNEIMEIL